MGIFWRRDSAIALRVLISKLKHWRDVWGIKTDPAHPSLHFKTVDNGKFHSVSVGLYYRALGLPVLGGVHWFWVCTHGEYDKLVG